MFDLCRLILCVRTTTTSRVTRPARTCPIPDAVDRSCLQSGRMPALRTIMPYCSVCARMIAGNLQRCIFLESPSQHPTCGGLFVLLSSHPAPQGSCAEYGTQRYSPQSGGATE